MWLGTEIISIKNFSVFTCCKCGVHHTSTAVDTDQIILITNLESQLALKWRHSKGEQSRAEKKIKFDTKKMCFKLMISCNMPVSMGHTLSMSCHCVYYMGSTRLKPPSCWQRRGNLIGLYQDRTLLCISMHVQIKACLPHPFAQYLIALHFNLSNVYK